MGSLVLLLSFSLVSLLRAEVPHLFLLTGEELLLEVQKNVTLGEDNDQIKWSSSSSTNIARHIFRGTTRYYGDFSGRAELFPGNLSLLLRGLTKNDSGVYKALVSGTKDTGVAEYKVTVLDPVSPVKLTVKSCSSDSSNLTVTCSTQDSLISRTFTCDNQSCSEERGEGAEFTTPAASLKVYLMNNSIICVHSNQVSRTEDVRKIEDLCKKDPESDADHQKNIDVLGIVLPILGVTLLLLTIGVFLYRQRRRTYKTQNMENTVYEVPQGNMDVPLEQRPMNDPLLTDPPPTIYHLLGHPAEPEVKPLPESVYATVQKVANT